MKSKSKDNTKRLGYELREKLRHQIKNKELLKVVDETARKAEEYAEKADEFEERYEMLKNQKNEHVDTDDYLDLADNYEISKDEEAKITKESFECVNELREALNERFNKRLKKVYKCDGNTKSLLIESTDDDGNYYKSSVYVSD